MIYAMRVYRASFRRRFLHMIRYGSYYRKFLFFSPIHFVLPFAFAFKMFGDTSHEWFLFVLIGTLAWSLFHYILWDISLFLREEQELGTLEPVFLTPAPRCAWLFGTATAAALFDLLGTMVSGLVVFWIFREQLRVNPLTLTVFTILVLVATMGMGLLIASLMLYLRKATNVFSVVMDAAFSVSGATFPIWRTPGWIASLAFILPFALAVMGVRGAVMENKSIYEAKFTMVYLAAIGAVLMFVGRWVFASTERRLRQTGSLHKF